MFDDDRGRLVDEEEMETGKVTWKVYLEYAKHIGIFKSIIILILYVGCKGLQTGSDVWLSQWADVTEANQTLGIDKAGLYLGVYGGLGVTAGVFEAVREFMLFVSCVVASKLIHNNLLFSVIKSPMSFFDTTPNGRILNRFRQVTRTSHNKSLFEISSREEKTVYLAF